LVLLLTGAMMTARPLRAQQKAMPVIGLLFSGSINPMHRFGRRSARG
jgi:hypothetical protein